MISFLLTVALAATLAPPANAHPSSELVAAIRYLTPKGVSHSHLYLFQEDGKLLRQLTRDNSGQDQEPRFSPDGEAIVFEREIPNKPMEYWSVRPRGGDLRKLADPPDWYTDKGRSVYFTIGEPTAPAEPPATDFNPTIRTPDGRHELLLHAVGEEEQMDLIGYSGKHYTLRDTRTGREQLFSALPGFEGANQLLHDSRTGAKQFLWEDGLHVAFFELHLNSTDGTTVYALDFDRKQFVRLSPNWATPIPLPGEPAFLTRTENRYVPITGTKKTANCSYVDRWDRNLHQIRYGRNVAAICYGASMYRPNRKPHVIDVR